MSDMRSPIRLGITGCGIISRTHIRASLNVPNVEVTAVSSRSISAVDRICDEFSIEHRFSDWLALVASDDIDAVLICLPDGLHEPATVEAARNGKHVLVEKPMGNNLGQCKAMVAATDKAGVRLMVAQMVRQFPSHQLAKRMIQDDRIGSVRRAVRRRHWQLEPALAAGAKRPWMSDSALCTDGLLFGLGSHEYDALLWLFETEAAKVVARGTKDERVIPGWLSIDGSVALRSGIDVDVSLSLQSDETVWDTYVEGTKGAMTIYDDRVILDNEDFACPKDTAFTAQLEEFAESIHDGRDPGPSGRNVLGTMAVLDGVIESLSNERPAEIEEMGIRWQ